MEIQYPQTLELLWKHLHGTVSSNFHAEEAYEELLKIILKVFDRQKNKEDIASDFLASLWTGAIPIAIRSRSILISQAKKFAAHQNNPVQFELNGILHKALITLEKQGVIERDSNSVGHNISFLTHFALKGTPIGKMSSMEDYEKNKGQVDFFYAKIRNNEPEKTKMLAPADALNLTQQLLKAFGGWTKKTDIFHAMQNHIPKQMQIVSESDDENRNLENISIADDDSFYDSFDDEFRILQASNIAKQTVMRIWKRICQESCNKVFCLYTLPSYFEHDVKMIDVGKTSTVFDQNKKLRSIMQSELKNYKDSDIPSEKAVVNKIVRNLNGKCTESGYNPNLYV